MFFLSANVKGLQRNLGDWTGLCSATEIRYKCNRCRPFNMTSFQIILAESAATQSGTNRTGHMAHLGSYLYNLQLSFFKFWTNFKETSLLCVCYKYQWQGPKTLLFLQDHLDCSLHVHLSKNIMIVDPITWWLGHSRICWTPFVWPTIWIFLHIRFITWSRSHWSPWQGGNVSFCWDHWLFWPLCHPYQTHNQSYAGGCSHMHSMALGQNQLARPSWCLEWNRMG